jgi:hypothetical protein
MSSRQYVKYKTKSRPRRLGNVMSPALPAIGDVIVEKPRKSTFTLSGSKFNKYYNKKSSGYPMAMPTGYRQRTYRKFTPKVKSKVDKKNEALDFFDATKNTEHTLPLPNSLGVSVPLNFSSRYSPSTSTTANTHVYYIIQFTDSQCVGAFYSMVGTTATAVASLTPLLFTDLDTNPPTSFRASRLTATLLNTTSITNVAGSVSALYLMNGLEWEFDATLFSISAALQNEIRTMIESNSKSKIFSASNFVGDSVKNKFSLVPTSMANLENWLTYGNSQSSVALQKATLINGAQHFTHSTLILRFENTSVANTYTLLLNGQYSTRYPANSILTSIARKDLYPKKELVEEHSKILDSEGYHGLLNGGIS